MDTQLTKLIAPSIQCVEIALLSRDAIPEAQFSGDGIAEAVRMILDKSSGAGATRQELLEAFEENSRLVVEGLIDQLLSKKILIPDNSEDLSLQENKSDMEIFYSQFEDHPSLLVSRLKDKHVVIVGVNCISHQMVTTLTKSSFDHLSVIDSPLLRNTSLFDDTGNLKNGWGNYSQLLVDQKELNRLIEKNSFVSLVATSDHGGLQILREWNKFCVTQQIPFLPVSLIDQVGYVGPLVIPGETSCFECLKARQNSHLMEPLPLKVPEQMPFEGRGSASFHPAMATILGDLAAFELIKFYGETIPGSPIGNVLEVNLLQGFMKARKVLKIPRCPVCASLNIMPSTGIEKRFPVPNIRGAH